MSDKTKKMKEPKAKPAEKKVKKAGGLFKKQEDKTAMPVAKKRKIRDNLPDEMVVKNLVSDNSAFNIREAYKTTRTNIMFSLASKEGCKVIIVTSSIPGEGKTLTTINTALTFAQTGARVLLIDGDLRKSKIHKYMNVDNSVGLSNLLGSFASVDECIKRSEEHNLDYITTGHTPPNPLELLSSQKMMDTIEFLKTKYDYIFIDTPPVNVVADATAISSMSDGILFVVRYKYTTQDMLSKAISSIEFVDGKILGFLLNDVDLAHFTYSAKSRYGKYSYRNYYYYSNYYY